MKLFIKISLILMAVAIFSSCSQTETEGFEDASLEIATKSMNLSETLEDADKEGNIEGVANRSSEDVEINDDDSLITDDEDEDDEGDGDNNEKSAK